MKQYKLRGHITFAVVISVVFIADASHTEPYELPDNDSIQVEAYSASEGNLNMYSRPEPLYKTPEAMAFQEFGRFGTQGSNGSVDISIPIHTIECRDLRIPIALHYGGRGIKVAEEASWVGLGWDLSIGGCINYVAAGQHDYLVRNAQWSDYLEVLNTQSASAFQFQANANSYTVMQDLINGMGERDFYSVNLLGNSFLFFINPYTEQPTIIGADNMDYSISRSGADGWLVKDCFGYEYDFSALEYSLADGAGTQKSAWYLSSIFTPEGITATFRYDTTRVRSLPQAYQWHDVQRGSFSALLPEGGSVVYDIPAYGSGVSSRSSPIIHTVA